MSHSTLRRGGLVVSHPLKVSVISADSAFLKINFDGTEKKQGCVNCERFIWRGYIECGFSQN